MTEPLSGRAVGQPEPAGPEAPGQATAGQETVGRERVGRDVGAGTVEEARQEIERTRRELGETVHALAEKTDVKAQLRRKTDEAKAHASEKASSLSSSISAVSPGGSDPVGSLKQVGAKLSGAVRVNPPAAMTVAVLVGLLVGRSSKRKRSGQKGGGSKTSGETRRD